MRIPTFLLHPSSHGVRDDGRDGAGDDANALRLSGGRLEHRQ